MSALKTRKRNIKRKPTAVIFFSSRGFLMRGPSGEELACEIQNTEQTVESAYEALISACGVAIDLKHSNVVIKSSSEIVMKALHDDRHAPADYISLFVRARKALQLFKDTKLECIMEKNDPTLA